MVEKNIKNYKKKGITISIRMNHMRTIVTKLEGNLSKSDKTFQLFKNQNHSDHLADFTEVYIFFKIIQKYIQNYQNLSIIQVAIHLNLSTFEW